MQTTSATRPCPLKIENHDRNASSQPKADSIMQCSCSSESEGFFIRTDAKFKRFYPMTNYGSKVMQKPPRLVFIRLERSASAHCLLRGLK